MFSLSASECEATGRHSHQELSYINVCFAAASDIDCSCPLFPVRSTDRRNIYVMAHTYVAPTLVTYTVLSEEGRKSGWSDAMLEKPAVVKAAGLEAIEICKRRASSLVLAPIYSVTLSIINRGSF